MTRAAQIAGLIVGLQLCLFSPLFSQTKRVHSNNCASGIENGGNMRFTYQAGPVAKDVMTATVRDFVWTHWVKKSCGKVSTTHYTIEGDSIVTEFFVRQDNELAWVVDEMVTHKSCCFARGRGVVERSRYKMIDRVEIITFADSPEIPKPISSDCVRESRTYRLRLIAAQRDNDFIF